MDHESELRLAAIAHVLRLRDQFGGVVPKRVLAEGLQVGAEHVKLAQWQRGIHKPSGWSSALTIRTGSQTVDADGYEDGFLPDGATYRYSYQAPRGDSTAGRQRNADLYNGYLREAMQRNVPLIMLARAGHEYFIPFAPVLVVDDDQTRGVFTLDVAASPRVPDLSGLVAERAPEYTVRSTKERVHRGVFRAEVMAAYQARCAVCDLRHETLLDAAHLVPDSEGGPSTVTNGMAMCRLHHSAFDDSILGIDPAHVIHIRRDILDMEDGPVHKAGLVDLHGSLLRSLPSRRRDMPDPDALEIRFERFIAEDR